MESNVIKESRAKAVEKLLKEERFTTSAFQRNIDTAMCAKGISMTLYRSTTTAIELLEQGIRKHQYNEADIQLLRSLYLLDRGKVSLTNIGRFNVQMGVSKMLKFMEDLDMDHGGVLSFVDLKRHTFRGGLDEIQALVAKACVYASYAYGHAMGKDGDFKELLYKLTKCEGKGEMGAWCITDAQRLLEENRHFSHNAYDDKVMGYLNPRPAVVDDGTGKALQHVAAW